MFDNFNLLGIAVSGMNDITPPEPTVIDDTGAKAFWFLVLIAIIIICLLLSKYLPDAASVKNAKKIKEQKKIEQARNEELERLHNIKKKNKRK